MAGNRQSGPPDLSAEESSVQANTCWLTTNYDIRTEVATPQDRNTR